MQRTQLRSATQTRRGARAGFPEPDDFEGLPVRQWRQEWVNVAPTLQQEMAQQGDRWAVELPFGMPREAHLLPPHTQELLRAARSGRLYKRASPAEEEDAEMEVDPVKGEKKDWEPPNEGYMVKAWKQVPRNEESPTTSYLAKRHKNTVTLSSKAEPAPVAGPTVIRATVRRIDAAGNPYEQTVTLSEGQRVDGEIISTTVVPAPQAAPELPVQQPTPTKRRPPPPKRKPKGFGRGRKKGMGRLPLPLPATRSHDSTTDGTTAVKSEGAGSDVGFHASIAAGSPGRTLTADDEQGIKIEDNEDSRVQDSEMVDMSGVPSEDEGEGGGGEEGEEGDEEGGVDQAEQTTNIGSADGDGQSEKTEGSEMMEIVPPTSVGEPDDARPAPSEEDATVTKARVQPPSLTHLGPPHHASSRIEGSPLKNVMLQSPTEANSTSGSFSSSSYLDVHSRTTSISGVLPSLRGNPPPERVVVQYVAATVQQFEAPPPASSEVKKEPTAEAPDQAQAAPKATVLQTTETSTTPAPAAAQSGPQPAPDDSLQPPASPPLNPTVTEDEDEGLNLLGSLERELDRQERISNASNGSGEKRTPDGAATTATATATTAAMEVDNAEAASSSTAAADADAQARVKEEEGTEAAAPPTQPF
ncbi:uncharacterized protein B0T15DRAFT_73319 [Chaetomium strumarium]|uniref:Uncharacterized protein n=1 Tax=Chaetomium strumarium TaxID=1170767 RepID=A0AAJ0H3Z6_9PEZI|nr:hypothetical protein B0T15DRAFT_73319 [Chaetomium strumarium]